jgi:hypothetical protein
MQHTLHIFSCALLISLSSTIQGAAHASPVVPFRDTDPVAVGVPFNPSTFPTLISLATNGEICGWASSKIFYRDGTVIATVTADGSITRSSTFNELLKGAADETASKIMKAGSLLATVSSSFITLYCISRNELEKKHSVLPFKQLEQELPSVMLQEFIKKAAVLAAINENLVKVHTEKVFKTKISKYPAISARMLSYRSLSEPFLTSEDTKNYNNKNRRQP